MSAYTEPVDRDFFAMAHFWAVTGAACLAELAKPLLPPTN
jgi:hypothetical protein